jgi:hypothetical protein
LFPTFSELVEHQEEQEQVDLTDTAKNQSST